MLGAAHDVGVGDDAEGEEVVAWSWLLAKCKRKRKSRSLRDDSQKGKAKTHAREAFDLLRECAEASGAGGEGDAGDACVIVEELDVAPAFEEFGERVALTEAELESEEAGG